MKKFVFCFLFFAFVKNKNNSWSILQKVKIWFFCSSWWKRGSLSFSIRMESLMNENANMKKESYLIMNERESILVFNPAIKISVCGSNWEARTRMCLLWKQLDHNNIINKYDILIWFILIPLWKFVASFQIKSIF